MHIGFWMLVAALVLVSIYAVIATLAALGKLPIPIFDRGSSIFATTSPVARNSVISVCRHYGMKPLFRFDTSTVLRALMERSVIINYTQPDVHELLGTAGSGLGLAVEDPWSSANEAAIFLREQGHRAEAIRGEDVEREVPKGRLAFVTTDAFVSAVFVFRKHAFKMGGRPQRWKQRG